MGAGASAASVRSWGVDEVAAYLESNELAGQVEAFRAAGVDGPQLMDMTPERLAELGVTDEGATARLQAAVEALLPAAVESAARTMPPPKVMDPDLANNSWPASLQAIKDAGGKMSVMAQVVDQEMFDRLKDTASPNGWTLARAINSGTTNPTSFVGCHAGDMESYDLFSDLFHPVIEKYHKMAIADINHVTDMDNSKIQTPLSDLAKSMLKSTRIRCARNLSFFPLNPSGTQETRLEVMALMEQVFNGLEGDLAGTLYKHAEMTPEQTQELIDKHWLFRGNDNMQAASGYHEFWPHGRGIFVSADEKFMSWINEGDHMRIISMEQNGEVNSVFDRLCRASAAIEAGLKSITGRDQVFMSHEKFGMITCCPSNLGTAMRGGVHMLLPKLLASEGFEKIDEIAREMNCQARGSDGEHSAVKGGKMDISNWRRLGVPEYELVEDMIRCVNKFAEMEEAAPAVPEEGSESKEEPAAAAAAEETKEEAAAAAAGEASGEASAEASAEAEAPAEAAAEASAEAAAE